MHHTVNGGKVVPVRCVEHNRQTARAEPIFSPSTK